MEQNNSAHGDYVSNPFIAALDGVKKFYKNGQSTMWGLLSIQVALVIAYVVFGVVAFGSFLVVAFSYFASLIGGPDQLASVLSVSTPEALQIANGLAYAKQIAIWLGIICAAISVLFAAFAQAVNLNFFSHAVIKQQSTPLKVVVKSALKQMWPLIAQGLLIFFGVFLASLLPGLIASIVPSGNFLSTLVFTIVGLYYFAFFFAIVYVGARISLSAFALINNNLGPIQAIKHSWKITDNKVGEIIGIMAVIFSFTFVAIFVVNFVSGLLAGLNISILTLVVMLFTFLASTAISIVAMAPMAERFAQLQKAYDSGLKTHKANWGSIAGAIGLAIGLFIVSIVLQALVYGTAMNDTPTTQPSDAELDAELQQLYKDLEKYQTGDTTPTTDSVDVDFDQFYQDYLNDNQNNIETN